MSRDWDTGEDDRGFDELVRSAARPSAPVTGEVRAELRALALATIAQADHPRRLRKRWMVPAAVVAAAVVVGGGGVAVASLSAEWSGWAKDAEWSQWATEPVATVSYELPGGGSCEQRFGLVQSSTDPSAVLFAEQFMRSTDLLAEADVDAAIRQIRSEEYWVSDATGNPVLGGYGTDYYNADREFDHAVSMAVQQEILAAVEAAGHGGVTFSSQTRCEGATW